MRWYILSLSLAALSWATFVPQAGAGHPPSGKFYPNDEYLYEFAHPDRFSANPRMSGDVYYNYPHAKPSPIVTYRFGQPAGRYAWGHFGAKPHKQPVYHKSANEHYQQTTVRRGP